MGGGAFDPDVLTADVTLADGLRLRLRSIRPSDKDSLLEGFGRLSSDSRYRRFFAPMPRLSPSALTYLTEVDSVNHVAVVAVVLDLAADEAEPDHGAAVARYIRLLDRQDAAEVALAVTDDYQGHGIGSLMMDALIGVALRAGITTFVALVRYDNEPMRRILYRIGAGHDYDSGGILRYEIELAARLPDLRRGLLGPALGLDAAGPAADRPSG